MSSSSRIAHAEELTQYRRFIKRYSVTQQSLEQKIVETQASLRSCTIEAAIFKTVTSSDSIGRKQDILKELFKEMTVEGVKLESIQKTIMTQAQTVCKSDPTAVSKK